MTKTSSAGSVVVDEIATPDGVGPQPSQAERTDKALRIFLRLGLAVLVVALVGFGFLYFRDQHTVAAPSIVDQTIAKAEAAVRQSPNNVPARLALGTAYTESKRYDDAVAQFDEVLKVDPANTDARMGKGFALFTKGDMAGAAAEYTKVTEAQRTGEFAGADTRLEAAYYYLGMIANKQGQPTKALEQLTHALQISPTDSDAIYQVGVAQALMGKHTEAIDTFKKALTFVPTGWCDPYQQMQASYTTLNQPEKASYATAMFTYCTGHAATGKEQLTALTSGPAGIEAMLGLGIVAQIENDTPTAVGWYQKVLTKDPKNITAMSYLAALGVNPSSSPAPSATPTK